MPKTPHFTLGTRVVALRRLRLDLDAPRTPDEEALNISESTSVAEGAHGTVVRIALLTVVQWDDQVNPIGVPPDSIQALPREEHPHLSL